MKLWKYLLYVFSGTITAIMMNNSGTGNQPSISLLCDIMMYKNKDISFIPAIKWGLKHEAIISCNCHCFDIIEIKCLLDVNLV